MEEAAISNATHTHTQTHLHTHTFLLTTSVIRGQCHPRRCLKESNRLSHIFLCNFPPQPHLRQTLTYPHQGFKLPHRDGDGLCVCVFHFHAPPADEVTDADVFAGEGLAGFGGEACVGVCVCVCMCVCVWVGKWVVERNEWVWVGGCR